LRRQFSNHDVEEGDDRESQEKGNAVHQFRLLYADETEDRFEQVGKGRLADPAETQRGERDAELAGGEIGIHLAVDARKYFTAPSILLRNRLDAGLSQLDQAEFGRHEETVEEHQKQGEQ